MRKLPLWTHSSAMMTTGIMSKFQVLSQCAISVSVLDYSTLAHGLANNVLVSVESVVMFLRSTNLCLGLKHLLPRLGLGIRELSLLLVDTPISSTPLIIRKEFYSEMSYLKTVLIGLTLSSSLVVPSLPLIAAFATPKGCRQLEVDDRL